MIPIHTRERKKREITKYHSMILFTKEKPTTEELVFFQRATALS